MPQSLLRHSLPTSGASSRPTEPDYPCYVQTQSGRVINLTTLCTGKPTAINVTSEPIIRQTALKPQKQAAKGGQVAETAREIKGSASGWTLSGKVQNQTKQSISGLAITLSINVGSQKLVESMRTKPLSVPPGGYADFKVAIPGDLDHRPDFRVALTQWHNEDGTAGQYP
ncbi:hypothetical protein H6F86_30915 [Phormidium sp. FACHB-592]|uniref:Uncharacterized protein n=1 Tax=Stenomitos frigidus AS-A4 TaxID=2933935 RepID=A0ABV0KRS2_9CYAN|nr:MULTISPECIES: hypothetical protein [Cyanophyceae]MBD2033585.1 hypothetical protein [Leptolyngbya sp. FACHB-321]MBD2078224.1 hypothetical protein [Phormidium sp. FACHB-592]